MPTERGSKPGQLEDHIKRIARRILDRRKKHNANRSREDQAAAVKLIQFQQQQDRMAAQHELERLDRYEGSAAQHQAEAARQLRRRRATTKTSTTPDGKTRVEFRPVPPKFQPADYIWRLSGQILQHILTARWKLQHGQRADRELLVIERLRQRGNGYLQRHKIQHSDAMRRGGTRGRGDRLSQLIEDLMKPEFVLAHATVVKELTRRADDRDPNALVVRVGGGRFEYRPKPGGPAKMITIRSLSDRITRVKKRHALR
jgi:hypothetical protein